MSLETLRQREIEILSMSSTTVDDYGNEVVVASDPVVTYATRQQLSATEVTLDRDQQTITYRYFFKPEVSIHGRDQIVDDGVTLKIIGEPEVCGSPLVDHHIEAIARVVES